MIGQFFSAELAVVLPFVILALIAFAIVALVTARRDPDPAGSRPYAIYLVLIIFFSMFTALFALTAVASNVAKIPQSDSTGQIRGVGVSSSISHEEITYDPGKQETAAAVEAALVLLGALGVMCFHVARLR